jgi:isopentenyl-diphosphate delta-isomerase
MMLLIMKEMINLVDKNGARIGQIEKIEAHTKGLLHEAFSIFIFDNEGNLLLQKRNSEKYHSGGLWTNSCCSHARVNEDIEKAAHRRLVEEMGFDTELEKKYSFIYKVDLDHELIEHEHDYVFIGICSSDLIINPNPDEVEEYKWLSMDVLNDDVKKSPEKYTTWLSIILKEEKFKNMHSEIFLK